MSDRRCTLEVPDFLSAAGASRRSLDLAARRLGGLDGLEQGCFVDDRRERRRCCRDLHESHRPRSSARNRRSPVPL